MSLTIISPYPVQMLIQRRTSFRCRIRQRTKLRAARNSHSSNLGLSCQSRRRCRCSSWVWPASRTDTPRDGRVTRNASAYFQRRQRIFPGKSRSVNRPAKASVGKRARYPVVPWCFARVASGLRDGKSLSPDARVPGRQVSSLRLARKSRFEEATGIGRQEAPD